MTPNQLSSKRPAIGAHLPGLALLACLGGCAHAHQAPPAAQVPATKPDHERAAETGITVASTPEGLMRPGAEEKLRARLREKGLLGDTQGADTLDPDTRAALRTFQKREGLPTTGLPSYETVEHLGLDPDAIFHSTRAPRAPSPPGGSS